MPMTKAHYLTFKLIKEFKGRYMQPAGPHSLFLIWSRWDMRWKTNTHRWRHVQRIAGQVDKYERIQYARYKSNNWVPIYNGDRCTPTFYDRLKCFTREDPPGWNGDSRIKVFDRQFSYGASEVWNPNNIQAARCNNNRRFYHGIHNLKMELYWLSYYRHYIRNCISRGWQPSYKDRMTMINLFKFQNGVGWAGFFVRYDIDPILHFLPPTSNWGMDS